MQLRKFSPEAQSPYDMNSYAGRVLHFMRIINPQNMLYSSQDIRDAQKLLEDYSDEGFDNKLLWKAKYAVMSNLHPDTKKEISAPFKMSAFVPVNIPIALGLSLSAPTTFNIALFQILNQSYNFGVNVCNGNQTNVANNVHDYTGRYMLAVTSSLVVALGTVAAIKRTRFGKNELFLRVGPFLGTATASALNLGAARYLDATQGIILKDEKTGESFDQHRSKKAGIVSIAQGALSRSLIPLPVFVLPPVIQHMFKKRNVFPASKIGQVFFNTSIAAFTLWLALPLSIGVFPQEGRIHRSKLESQFQDLKNSHGDKVEYFVFNRGL